MYQHDFYVERSSVVARKLLGSKLVFKHHKAIITETEAYEGTNDPASHAYKGITERNKIMFGEPGFAYIYLIYGIHLCLNITTFPSGKPGSVFIRAILLEKKHINGPGKLSKALGITIEENSKSMCDGNGFYLAPGISIQDNQINALPRIGIKVAKDKLWRFNLKLPYSIDFNDILG